MNNWLTSYVDVRRVNAQQVEKLIIMVAEMYPNHPYERIRDACSILCTHYPHTCRETLDRLYWNYPEVKKDFMSILDTLASPAKAEIVKDKPE